MGRWTMSVLLLGALTTGCNQSSVGDPAPSRGFPEVTATLTFEGVTYGGNMNITTDLGEERLSFTGYAMEGSDVIGGASLTIQQTLTRSAWNESSYDLYDQREDWFITEDGFQPGTMQLGEQGAAAPSPPDISCQTRHAIGPPCRRAPTPPSPTTSRSSEPVSTT
ncbi:MAG: hypothetical protein IPG17_05570 [Sandaracinaceae bacterium]|nr:hypothetical protein [Sandaracinaceae bacterium]